MHPEEDVFDICYAYLRQRYDNIYIIHHRISKRLAPDLIDKLANKPEATLFNGKHALKKFVDAVNLTRIKTNTA